MIPFPFYFSTVAVVATWEIRRRPYSISTRL